MVEEKIYCPEHGFLSELAKKAIPRWAFVVSVSVWFTISGGFSLWYAASLNQFKLEVDLRLKEIELHLNERIQISRELYNRDAERNYQLLTKIEGSQKELELKVERIGTRQDAVFKKLDLE